MRDGEGGGDISLRDISLISEQHLLEQFIKIWLEMLFHRWMLEELLSPSYS